MGENIETSWSLDLPIIEQLSQLGTAFDKVGDKEDAVKKKDPFKESARSAAKANKELLDGVKTYVKIEQSAKAYENEVKKLTTIQAELNRRTDEFKAAGKYKELQAELKKVEDRLKTLNKEKERFEKFNPPKLPPTPTPAPVPTRTPTPGLGGRLGSIGGGLVGQVTGLVGGLFALEKAWDLAVKGPAEFGRALSQLSAITGATGDDLKFLEQQALEFEKTTGKSALSIVQAFQVVGSIKPELLESKELLTSVTKEVLALQDAAGNISLEQAAESLLGAMNQFGVGAEEASRFVNVLAAGAAAGSSEIADTSAAFKNAGTAMAAANLSFEESNALVQDLASVMIRGGEAGTALRNVILKLETSTDKNLRPSVVGLDTALANASVKFNTTTKLAKEFGSENIVAAQHILSTREEIARLTKELTGTDTAYEQQRINLDNLATDLDKLGTSFTGFFRNLGREQDGFLRYAIQSFTNFFNQLSDKTSDLRGMLGILFSIDKVGAYQEFQQNRANRAAADARRVSEEGIRRQANTEVPGAVRAQTEALMKQGIEKNKAEIQAAQSVLKQETDNLNKARKFYTETQQKFVKTTSESEKNRLRGDLKLDAQGIKTAKARVAAAQKEVENTEKRAANQKKALDSALLDEQGAKTKGDKAQKIRDRQAAKAVDLQEKLNSELLKLENEFGKERLEALGRESTKFLQEKARLDIQLIDQEQQAYLKLKQMAAGAAAGKFDKTGDPIADTSVELDDNELNLFERRRQAVIDRLNREQQETYKKEIDETKKHQDAINALVGTEYDRQVEQVNQKYSEVLKLVEKGSQDEIKLTKAKMAELRKLELERKMQQLNNMNEVRLSNAELRVIQAQIDGNLEAEIKAQIKLLEAERDGLQSRLNLLSEFDDEASKKEMEIVANRIDAITSQIEKIKRGPAARNIWDVFGLTNNMQDAIRSLQPVADAFQQFADIQLQASQERVSLIEKEIQEKKKQIDAENQLNKEGVANNLRLRESELVQLKSQRAKALQEQRQAQRLANAQETATQIAGMITASVNLLKTSTILGPVAGPIVAKIAIASMFGLYAASKVKAAQLARQQEANQIMRKGGWLDGPSHEQGGIRGRGAFGHVEVEGGEHITRKSRAARYADLLNAINEGGHKPFPWAGIQKLAAERGVLLHESSGIASPRAIQSMASSYRDRAAMKPLSEESLQALHAEMAGMRKENTELLKKLHGKSSWVHNGKLYEKEGFQTTIKNLE